MYRVLIADDEYEDRELLKLEIEKALSGLESELLFTEASSVKQALEYLHQNSYDLLTLDIEFDRLNEGLEVLPEIFEKYPTLNIIVISGKLNKAEISGELFRFTKDNVLKSKRWARHFDVLDKKDSKTSAIRSAFEFALKKHDSAENIRELFAQAEECLATNEVDKCRTVYERIQELAPGESESRENLKLLKGEGLKQALEYLNRGETVVASLLLGHEIEYRLKQYTKKMTGRAHPGLFECLKELEKNRRVSQLKRTSFHKLMKLRNRAVHHPKHINENDFKAVRQELVILEAKI